MAGVKRVAANIASNSATIEFDESITDASVPLPSTVLITGIVLVMGLIPCLATVQSVTFAGIMTLLEVGGLLFIFGAGVFFGGSQTITRLPEALPPFSFDAWTGIGGTALIAVFAFIGFEHLVDGKRCFQATSRKVA